MTPPVHLFPGITVEDRARALKSIHRSVQLIPWFWHLLLLRFKGSPAHVGTPFRAGHQARYPASYPPTIREELPVVQSAVSCCVSAAGIRFLDTLSCQTEFRPHYCRPTARTAHTRARAADPGRVYTFHTRETRTGPGALCTPGTAVFSRPSGCPWPPPAASQRPVPATPVPLPNPGCRSDEASARVSC